MPGASGAFHQLQSICFQWVRFLDLIGNQLVPYKLFSTFGYDTLLEPTHKEHILDLYESTLWSLSRKCPDKYFVEQVRELYDAECKHWGKTSTR